MDFALLPHPQAPELGLDVRVGFQGYFHRSAIALAGDALGFDLGLVLGRQ